MIVPPTDAAGANALGKRRSKQEHESLCVVIIVEFRIRLILLLEYQGGVTPLLLTVHASVLLALRHNARLNPAKGNELHKCG